MTMPVVSHVLVVEPQEDPEVERVLKDPELDVRFATKTEEAFKLASAFAPAVLVVDMLLLGVAALKLLSRIFEEAARKGTLPPSVVLLTDQVATWQAAELGQVRLSDRAHLRETIRAAVLGRQKPQEVKGPEDWTPRSKESDVSRDDAWKAAVERAKAQGDQRFRGESERLRRRGILDERGEVASDEWPRDMRPDSTTDVAT